MAVKSFRVWVWDKTEKPKKVYEVSVSDFSVDRARLKAESGYFFPQPKERGFGRWGVEHIAQEKNAGR